MTPGVDGSWSRHFSHHLDVASASDLAMLHSQSLDPYPKATIKLQRAIKANGYRFSRVQRVDYGLRKRGYNTTPHRIVFFGNREPVRFLSVAQPELLPVLPLKIIIHEDGDNVILLAAHPSRPAGFHRGRISRLYS
jgi:uncharacterized protein (DUF302 family)